MKYVPTIVEILLFITILESKMHSFRFELNLAPAIGYLQSEETEREGQGL